MIAAVRLRVRLRDAEAKRAALVTVGSRERDQLLEKLATASGVLGTAERELAAARERLAEVDPAPSLVGKTLVISDPDRDMTLRGVLHAQHADRWTFREAILMTGGEERPVGGLVHVLVANIGPTQEVTEDLADKVQPLRVVEAASQ